MKKSLILLVVLILTGAFVSAGPQQEEKAAGQEAGQKAELTYWEMMWGAADTYTAAVDKLVAQFNREHPDIEVTVQMTPWANYYQTFLTAVTSGAAPDVSTGAFPQAIQYAQMGEILSLDSVVEQWKQEGSDILEDFVEGSLDLVTYEGHQVAIPWNSDVRVIVYRKDLFEQAGITAPPTSWPEFIEACRAVQKATGVAPFTFRGGDHAATSTLLNFMFMNGAGVTDENLRPTFDNPRVVETLEFFGTLYQEGLIPAGTVSYKGADANRVYYAGEAAILISNPPFEVFQYDQIANNSAVMPPFPGPSGEARALNWPNSMMAYQQTEHPEAAKTFIKWWIENNLPLWTEGHATSFPARMSFMEDPYFSSNWLTRGIKEMVMPVAVSPVWPATSLYPEFAVIDGENLLAGPLQQVISGGRGSAKNYRQIAEQFNQQIDKILKGEY